MNSVADSFGWALRDLSTRVQPEESDAHVDRSLRYAPFDQRFEKLSDEPRREYCVSCALDLMEFPPTVSQDDLDLNRFQSTGVDCRRVRPRQKEALTLSISGPTKLELVLADPDAWTQCHSCLADFFAKFAQGGFSVGLPGSERTARGDPSRARMVLIGTYLLQEDSVLRIQQHDARGRAFDELLGHPATIPTAVA